MSTCSFSLSLISAVTKCTLMKQSPSLQQLLLPPQGAVALSTMELVAPFVGNPWGPEGPFRVQWGCSPLPAPFWLSLNTWRRWMWYSWTNSPALLTSQLFALLLVCILVSHHFPSLPGLMPWESEGWYRLKWLAWTSSHLRAEAVQGK